MSEPTYRHLKYIVRDGVGTVRFRYAQQRTLKEYDEIDQELGSLADDEQLRALILDLDAFDYVPSRFLGTLVALLKKLSAMERRFAVCRMHTAAQSIFLTSRLDKIIPCYVSEEDARAALT